MYFVVFVIAIAVANLHRFSGGRRSQCHEGAIEAYWSQLWWAAVEQEATSNKGIA